jgi:hypothetical protein
MLCAFVQRCWYEKAWNYVLFSRGFVLGRISAGNVGQFRRS